MSFLTNLPIIGKIFEKTLGIIDKTVPDEDLRARLKAEIATADYSVLLKEIESQTQTLAAEMVGSDAQRNWRPHLMYLIQFFLFYLIVIVPIAGAFGADLQVDKALASVPEQMWTLITIGVGGYTMARSGEKMMDSWAKKSS